MCNKNEEKGYTIKGQVDGFEDSTALYLNDTKKDKVVDTSFVIDGKFTFKGQVNEPRTMMILRKNGKGERPDFTYFWVENSKITVKGNAENFKYATISGSAPQQIQEQMERKTKPYEKKKDSLYNIYMKLRKNGINKKNKKQFEAVAGKINELDSITNKIQMEFVKNLPNSYAALKQINFKKYKLAEDTLHKLYQKLNSKYKKTSYGQTLHDFLKLEKAQVGEQFIDFKATRMKGDTFRLSDIKNKYVILDFWSPGCGACRNANRFFSPRYKEMKDSIEIVGFALSKYKERIKKAVEKDSITWPVVSTCKGMDGETALQYKVRGVPTFYLIAPSGKIIDKFVGFSEKQYGNIMKSIEQHEA